ncbi:Uncharacterized protein GBIM_17846 [Gryllus bimaculatus]|nr:Uncharacterized protein GBIM_17846 [Gryllus bimaculatus]
MLSGPDVVYCDYTASGRSLQFIEDYVLREVLPCYGNTHTTTSITSMQSTLFRHEARDIIRNAVHASEHDAVIFAGSGCTGAVHKLIHALDLPESPVVFMGPYEHHSNLLPWRELGATVSIASVSAEWTKDGDLGGEGTGNSGEITTQGWNGMFKTNNRCSEHQAPSLLSRWTWALDMERRDVGKGIGVNKWDKVSASLAKKKNSGTVAAGKAFGWNA